MWALVDFLLDSGYVVIVLIVLAGGAAGVDLGFHVAIAVFHAANGVGNA
jgi:hypothetical protein